MPEFPSQNKTNLDIPETTLLEHELPDIPVVRHAKRRRALASPATVITQVTNPLPEIPSQNKTKDIPEATLLEHELPDIPVVRYFYIDNKLFINFLFASDFELDFAEGETMEEEELPLKKPRV